MPVARQTGMLSNGNFVIKATTPLIWISWAYTGRWLLSSVPLIAYIVADGSFDRPFSARGLITFVALALVMLDYVLAQAWQRNFKVVLHGWIAAAGVLLLLKPS